MSGISREKISGKPRVLLAPLDWGLGHATRCIPIIRELEKQGADVWLAGEGAQQELLQAEFQHIPFLSLPGYRIRYSKTGKGLAWKMIRQSRKLVKAIREEHKWLKKMIREHGFHGVISDNRFGLHHEKIHSVFITHQLHIKSSLGKWTEKILEKRNYCYINQFAECWVPDEAGGNNLAGELSHPAKTPTCPVKYIGWLSRFSRETNFMEEKKGDILIALSGPEPQRSLLEEKLLRDIAVYNGSATIVRGLPGNASLIPSTNMITVFNHLPAADMESAIRKAEWVISRSGYSTVMDIAAMRKKSILIPTPGQTEQEYLAEYLEKKKYCITVSQKNFSLAAALEKAKEFPYSFTETRPDDTLRETISRFLQSCKPALG